MLITQNFEGSCGNPLPSQFQVLCGGIFCLLIILSIKLKQLQTMNGFLVADFLTELIMVAILKIVCFYSWNLWYIPLPGCSFLKSLRIWWSFTYCCTMPLICYFVGLKPTRHIVLIHKQVAFLPLPYLK